MLQYGTKSSDTFEFNYPIAYKNFVTVLGCYKGTSKSATAHPIIVNVTLTKADFYIGEFANDASINTSGRYIHQYLLIGN